MGTTVTTKTIRKIITIATTLIAKKIIITTQITAKATPITTAIKTINATINNSYSNKCNNHHVTIAAATATKHWHYDES